MTPTVVTDLPEDHYLWKQELFLPSWPSPASKILTKPSRVQTTSILA